MKPRHQRRAIGYRKFLENMVEMRADGPIEGKKTVIACQTALAKRGVAVLIVPADISARSASPPASGSSRSPPAHRPAVPRVPPPCGPIT
jgi:hypothetical protein